MNAARDDAQAWRAVIDHAGHDAQLATVVRRVSALRRATEEALERAVRTMREDGWTWQEVGEAFGVTHQAARQRWRARGID